MILLMYLLMSLFCLWNRENSICCVSRWVRGEKPGVGVGVGGAALSVSLLLNVTGKIGKAFNVMQYLSNHPIKIRPNQSLPADWASTTLSLRHCWTSVLQMCIMFTYRESKSLWGFSFTLPFTLCNYVFLLLFCTRDEESVYRLSLWHRNTL